MGCVAVAVLLEDPPCVLRAVVVVLSREFLCKEHPMKEVRQIIRQREAGSKQGLCIVLHNISYEDCKNRQERAT